MIRPQAISATVTWQTEKGVLASYTETLSLRDSYVAEMLKERGGEFDDSFKELTLTKRKDIPRDHFLFGWLETLEQSDYTGNLFSMNGKPIMYSFEWL